MSENERGDRGRPDDRTFLAAVADDEPVGTADVAAAVGVSPGTAGRRLRALEDEGRVTATQVGDALVWTVAEGPVERVDPDDEFWEADAYDGEETDARDLDDALYG